MKELPWLLQKAGAGGMTVAEIAAALNMPEGTVRRYVAQLVKAGQAVRPSPKGRIFHPDFAPGRQRRASTAKPKSRPKARAKRGWRDRFWDWLDQGFDVVERATPAVGGVVSIVNEIKSASDGGVKQLEMAEWNLRTLAQQVEAAERRGDKRLAGHMRTQLEERQKLYAINRARFDQRVLASQIAAASSEELERLINEAHAADPPNLEFARLYIDELKRRAERAKAQPEPEPTSGVPARLEVLEGTAQVVKPEPTQMNGGRETTIPGQAVELYEWRWPTVVSEREQNLRAGAPVDDRLWPEDDPDTGIRREALVAAQDHRRTGIALRPARRATMAPTQRWYDNRRRELAGFRYRASEAAVKAQRKETEQRAIDASLAATRNAELDQLQERIKEIKRALLPTVLTGRLLSRQEREKLKTELGQLLAEAAAHGAG
jgi:DNA-binding Lrp family transcriptional regulator